ncbi:hypothetical protein PPL_10665 [Heterostelium album PN500]|uniref:EGF-like domain-containing protein n=1 Tax=Heterostelium pallidum (strain ATCC 26659 / Pp 5 / PN500) TaxID=670386 RepID=D3BRQ4_HETP5|nr:hypothetical protein PPL_10665 [Heterostelium album PN500]EFA76086.1 hypothetical protein PPL_10665 [Heterostelium album PN500]|eukprot:XP_020428220.1 hypothetical protein PPL_10665 [Heterostelium album PN500]
MKPGYFKFLSLILLLKMKNIFFESLFVSSVNWIIQQYKINFNILNLQCGALTGGITIKCDISNSITEIYFEDDNSPFVDNGQPNKTLDTFTFPKMTRFSFNKKQISIYDPTLSLINLIKPIGFPALNYLVHVDHEMTTIPPAISQLPLLTSLTLSANLALSPLLSLEYNPNAVSRISYLNIGLGMNDTSITFDSSILMPNIQTPLVLTLTLFNKNTFINIDTTYLKSLQVYSYTESTVTPPGFTLSGSKADAFYLLDINGPISSFSPQNLSIYSLGIFSSSRNNVFSDFPYSVISNKTASIGYSYSNLATFPIFTVQTPFTRSASLSLFGNNLSGTVPDSYYDSIFNSINIGGNVGITNITDEACHATAILAQSTSLQDIPECFKCYLKAYNVPGASDFRSTPFFQTFNPSTYSCKLNYTKHYVTYDPNKITIVGSNLGWAYRNDYDPRLTLLKINEKFLFNITGLPNKANVVLSIAANVSIDITWEIRSIVILEASLYQTPSGVFIQSTLNLTFGFNMYLDYWLDGAQCVSVGLALSPPTSNLAIGPPDIYKYDSLCDPVQGGLKNITISDPYSAVSVNSNLVLEFPIVTAASGLTVDGGVVTLSGSFSGTSNTSTMIGGKPCLKTDDGPFFITCYIEGPFSVGYQSLNVSDRGFYFVSNSVVVILPPPEDTIDYCKRIYENCSGHGQCSEEGKCVCDKGSGYYGVKCNQQIATGPNINVNNTTPSASINYKGFNFDFSIVAIQEIDDTEAILKEIPMTSNWTIDQITNVDGLSSVYYVFDTRNQVANLSIESVVLITNTSTSVEIGFGGQVIDLAPNSIKISVNITGWVYQTSLSHLRVVYRSPLSLDSCSNEPISITKDKDDITVQFLRVFSNDVEFFGRFTNIAVSNGRPTYSSVQLINQTISPNASESHVLLGINIPMCRECLIDPDFSALVNVDNQEKTCGEKSSNTWKIIVGVVVGGVVLIAALATATVLFMKKRKFKKDAKRMEAKLKRHTSTIQTNKE